MTAALFKYCRWNARYCASMTLAGWLVSCIWLVASSRSAAQETIPNPFDLMPVTGETVVPSAKDELSRDESPEGKSGLTESEVRRESDLGITDPATELPSELASESQSTSGKSEEMQGDSEIPSETTVPDEASDEVAGEADSADDDAVGDSSVSDVSANGQAELPDRRAAERGQGGSDPILENTYRRAMLIDCRGPIFGGFRWYLNQRLDRAKQDGVDLILIRMTTPGGNLEYSVELARRLRDIDWAKVIVWIPEESISGGAIIALGADRIYLREGAMIGDAGPIAMNLQGQFEHAPEKIVSYLTGVLRDLAESSGRSAAVAEAMADRDLVVYQATEIASGDTVYLTKAEVDDPQNQGLFQVGKMIPESGQNRFLTVSADRAVELQLAEGTFANEGALLQSLDIERLEKTEFTWVDQFVYVLNWRLVSALLLIVGLIGLYIEFAAPGISVAGLAALLCFGIFFWSHFLGGTANWLDVVLFALGVVCILAEIFVLPGFGVFGITGTLLVILALIMASQKFVLPEGEVQWAEFRSNLFLVLGSVGGVTLLLVVQILVFDSLPGLNRFRLKTVDDEAYDAGGRSLTSLTEVSAGRPELQVGQAGVADSDLRPSGKVRMGDQLVDVVSEGDYVSAGTPVQIIRIEGNRITVRKESM